MLFRSTDSTQDIAAALRVVEFQMGWYAHPLYTGDYPAAMRKLYGTRLPHFTEEESKLLKKYVHETKSNPATGLYGAIGVFTAALPIYIFVFILHVDLESNAIVMGIVSIAAAFALQKSYDNVADTLKPILEKTVKAAVTEKVNAQKDITKEQRTELIRKKTIAAADEQASALAIFKNNATFFFTLMILVFVLFVNLTLTTNYVLSVGISSGLTLLLSS